jgi:hypothetical protein
MAVFSRVNPNFPIPGIDQSSKGFRDNFATIKTEIENLQSKTITLTGEVTSPTTLIDSGSGPITMVTTGKSYVMTFSNDNIVANMLTVDHNFNRQYVSVTVFDNLNSITSPTAVTATNSNSVTVDFTGLTPLTGSWHVFVRG